MKSIISELRVLAKDIDLETYEVTRRDFMRNKLRRDARKEEFDEKIINITNTNEAKRDDELRNKEDIETQLRAMLEDNVPEGWNFENRRYTKDDYIIEATLEYISKLVAFNFKLRKGGKFVKSMSLVPGKHVKKALEFLIKGKNKLDDNFKV